MAEGYGRRVGQEGLAAEYDRRVYSRRLWLLVFCGCCDCSGVCCGCGSLWLLWLWLPWLWLAWLWLPWLWLLWLGVWFWLPWLLWLCLL